MPRSSVGSTIMAIPSRHAKPGKWLALYADRDGVWTRAADALGNPIFCDNRSLAHSVARYRRRRLRRF